MTEVQIPSQYFFLTGQSKKAKTQESQPETLETQETAPPKKGRKTFDKGELASLDAVFKASNGLPSSSMIQRLADSFELSNDQVNLI